MDASILVVGGDDFLAILIDKLRNLSACAVEVAASPAEADPIIQAQQPDLIVLQASQPDSLELCTRIKQQSRLAWIYCILLDDRVCTPPLMASREEIMAEALALAADAYLWLPEVAPQEHLRVLEGTLNSELYAESRMKGETVLVYPETLPIVEEVTSWNSLLQAHIHAGLRIVRNYRELIRTNDLLSAIAFSDSLTELNNRRALEWELPRQIQNARTRSVPLSLMMLDVDYFKSINDTYGHLVGDRALKSLADRLRHNLRFYDTPFRYGGEEFVIILSNTDAAESIAVSNRLRRLIAEQPFNVDGMTDRKITISAGVTSLEPDDDARGVSLLQRADQYLLRAKAEGRNRVISYKDVLL